MVVDAGVRRVAKLGDARVGPAHPRLRLVGLHTVMLIPGTMKRRTFFTTTAAAALLYKLPFARGTAMTTDWILADWTGPHGGFPRFDLIKADQFDGSISHGIDDARKEFAAIAEAKAAPTFKNT